MYYIQDPTHVCFWSKTTFQWLADKWQASVSFPAPTPFSSSAANKKRAKDQLQSLTRMTTST